MHAAIWKLARAASCFPQAAPELHGVVVIVRRDLTAEPPAHIRLVFGHDLFEKVASSIVPLGMPKYFQDARGQGTARRDVHSPWWDMSDIPPGADNAIA